MQLGPLGFILGFQNVLGDSSSYSQAQLHLQCSITLILMAESFCGCDLEPRRTTRALPPLSDGQMIRGRARGRIFSLFMLPFLLQSCLSLAFSRQRKRQKPTERLTPNLNPGCRDIRVLYGAGSIGKIDQIVTDSSSPVPKAEHLLTLHSLQLQKGPLGRRYQQCCWRTCICNKEAKAN